MSVIFVCCICVAIHPSLFDPSIFHPSWWNLSSLLNRKQDCQKTHLYLYHGCVHTEEHGTEVVTRERIKCCWNSSVRLHNPWKWIYTDWEGPRRVKGPNRQLYLECLLADQLRCEEALLPGGSSVDIQLTTSSTFDYIVDHLEWNLHHSP